MDKDLFFIYKLVEKINFNHINSQKYEVRFVPFYCFCYCAVCTHNQPLLKHDITVRSP